MRTTNRAVWLLVGISVLCASKSEGQYLDLDRKRELTLLALGTDFLGASLLVPAPPRMVPFEGFDPVAIDWAFDRGTIGARDPRAGRVSHHMRDAAIALPFVVAALTPAGDRRWPDLARTSLVYSEAMLISAGLTRLGKATLGRARPTTYLPSPVRLGGIDGHLATPSSFHSMPSGHSAAAWTGAAMAVTDHLLRRPDATGLERFAVGFLGGAFAGSTAALRVAAGVHFPSDVLAGAGIGIVTGVAVPLTHRPEGDVPRLEAWLQSAAGVGLGTLLGIAIARGY